MAKIMLIDDDVELASNFAEFLTSAGHDVVMHHSVDGAIAKLREEKPDLAVLDVMFPECSTGGFDLAREIKQADELKDLPVILLTGVNQHFPMDFSAEDIDPNWMPVLAFLEKPTSGAALCKKVQSLLDSAK